tara:strand:- start:146 stop:478 length:333 start_codon:yes stop_codon:yes gene_type:complete
MYKEIEIKKELLDYLDNNNLTMEDALKDDDLHFKVYNEDYFIIGYRNAEKWLIHNNENYTFNALNYVQEQEREELGEVNTTFDNAEALVNHYAYWVGYKIIHDLKNELSV